MTNHSNPCQIIKIDKQTNKIALPDILLETRSGKIIGKISKYENFNVSLVGIGIDEVSFDVHKYVNGKKCPVWDDLIDLKLIELKGYGRFQIKVSYTDNAETVKAIHGQSLEVELGQLYLNEFHVNDDEAMDMVYTDYSKGNYDDEGNFIPTVFCNFDDKNHSLLHRVLKDKAPHWSIGNVPTYVSMSEDAEAELSSKFQRTYTENGTSIYDFLTGTVAQETNVVFIFDTFKRKIHCYNLFDCYINGEIVEYGIGEDTLVFASKKNFLNEVSIESNQDQVKNCFRVEGGDDTITAMIAAVNMNGTNYIWKFSDFQFSDMSDELQKAIKDYQEEMSLQSTKDEYYGENGIYTKLCEAYEQLYLKKSTMMPSLTTVEVGTAEEQYNNIINGLNTSTVYVSNINNYSSSAFTGVTNQVESFSTILMDSRFEIEVVEGSTSFSYNKETDTYGIWKGKIKITQRTDETNTYPVIIENSAYVSVKIGNGKTEDGEIEYMRQKVQKALAKQDMANLDFSFTDSDKEIRSYFEQFSLNRLKSFYDAYNECISILAELVSTNKSDIAKDLYNEYYRVLTIIDGVKDTRQKEVDAIDSEISTLESKQRKFQKDHDFQKHLEKYGENLYKEFCMYRREDTYSNPNYTSDSLETTTELLNKAKELMEVADSELSKACMLQRTVSTSLSNLLILPEFEPLYDSFALFNYIRIKTDDEILKLRLIGVDFSGDSIENINVTFSEKVETIDGKVSDTESILQQAASIATSYSSTVKQAKQGESANKEFIDIYSNGLDATKAMLSNNDSNEITMTGAGLIAKRMDDEGGYGDKQLRITGNGMYLTDDAWKSLKMAVGEIIYTNPITSKEEKNYGIIASTIIGELIAGKQMHIGNENGSVLITGDGIKISKGTIEWGDDVNAPDIKDIPELTDSLNEVDLHLEQLDGRIQTFSQSNDPSLSWTNDEKKNHISDLWVNSETGLTKQWTGTTWIVVTDENLKKLASSKAQIFTSQPTTPYYVGDLWVQGETGDIMHCKTTKTSGTFDSTHWVISSKYTNNDKLYEFIDGDFADAMLDIGTKIDGKADTFYQSNSPHQEYTNITDNATYNLWVGDMWYDTDTGQTFMYQKENLGNNKYNYKWKFMDIPDEVFDIIDTKKTIYTTLPTNYNKDDMYILEIDRGSWEKGTILNALTTVKEQTTATFVSSHWKENVRYTDDSYIKEWIKRDFSEIINEVKTQVDQRAQTWYKTKSEMDAEVATWTDKSIHVGDLWYRTDVSEGEDQTFVYTSSYTWEVMNGVPKEVFDTIDDKKSIYTSLPTNYNINDMYILEVNRGSWKKGAILNATATATNQTTFVPSHWKENVRYTDDSYVKNWIENDFKQTINDVKGQVDQRAQTWYMTDSEMKAEVATWTDKSIHVGDLWYKTDADKNGKYHTYIYNSSYQWEEINGVPTDVFDMADGSCSLFVSKPTNGYRKNDMWILDVDNKSGTNSTYPKYAKGTLLVAKNDNTSYLVSDWEEQVKYSQDLQNFVSEYNTAISGIKGQLDKKANTYYQSDSPHPEYMSISENETYNIWEGDLWYDTDTGKTYIYQKEKMNNDKYNYKWQFMNVPEEVFDKIDGIRTIYTTLPLPTNTTANQGDLLIPDTGFTHGGVSYIAKKVYKYVGTSWVEIDYTDKTYVDEHVASELSAAKTELKEYADGTATTKTTELNQLVSKYLGLGGTTLMGSNLVVSPYIGGGYLYIKDARTTSNTGISVEINPNGTSFTGHNSNYVFNVQKNNNIIMGVTNNGQGYFSGGGKFTGTISIDGTNGVGAIDITGNGTTDRLLIHGASTIDRYENTYSRVDYQKFYVGNNSAVSHAGDGIIISTYDVFADYPHIRGWANGGTVSQAYLYAKSGFEIDSRGFMKIWTNEDEFGRNGHCVMINPDGSTFTSISATSYSFVNNSNNLITGSNSILGMVLNTDTSNGNKYIHIATSSGAYGVNVWASDTKLKKNIVSTTQTALDKINNLDFIQFDWKDGGSHVDLGLSANQVEEIIPDAIFDVVQDDSSEFDTLKNIDTTTMTVYALKAITELSSQIEELKQEIKELKGEN